MECPSSADASEVDLNTKSDITGTVPKSPLTPLGGSGLVDIALEPRVVHLVAPVDDNGDLQSRCEAALIETSFFLKARGSTTLSSLGKVMRAHTLVNLRGVGSRHSGLWFCSWVYHVIKPDEHVMSFGLKRNGWTD